MRSSLPAVIRISRWSREDKVFLSIRVFVFWLLGCVLNFTANAQLISPGPFRVSLSVNNRSISQGNFSDVLEVAGYRSTDCPGEPPVAGCRLLEGANVGIDYPSLQLGVSYAWSPLVASGINFTTSRNTGAYYANVYSANPEFDYLSWNTAVQSADVFTNFIVMKYPRKKQVGFQLSASGGFSVNSLVEELDVHLPADSVLFYTVKSSIQRKYGLNAVFALDAELFISPNVSFIPMQLKWYLPVIRPSFKESVFDNGNSRRTLSGRNYDLSGWFWYIGIAVHL